MGPAAPFQLTAKPSLMFHTRTFCKTGPSTTSYKPRPREARQPDTSTTATSTDTIRPSIHSAHSAHLGYGLSQRVEAQVRVHGRGELGLVCRPVGQPFHRLRLRTRKHSQQRSAAVSSASRSQHGQQNTRQPLHRHRLRTRKHSQQRSAGVSSASRGQQGSAEHTAAAPPPPAVNRVTLSAGRAEQVAADRRS